MAVGGDYSTSNQYIAYTITVVQNWQSIEGNYSNVSVYVRFRRTNTGYTTYGSGTVYCNINGTTYSASVTPNDKITNSGITLFSTTVNVYHRDDGLKDLWCSAWISHDRVSSSEQGFWTSLSTIPRASGVSGGSGTIEAGSTINISRHSSSFTHTIEYYFGNTSGTIATKTSSTSIAWTLPASLYAQIPNSASGTGTIYCHTYSSGGSYVGRSQCSFTASVASSKVPTLTSLTASQTAGLVMGKTKTTLTINGAAAVCNASISSYRIWCDNPSVSSSSKSFAYSTNTAGSLVFKATVTDSRGRTSAAKTITLSVAPYSPPTLSGFTAKRCLSNGTLNDRGTYLVVYANATFAACTTTKTMNIYSKKNTATTWSAATAYSNATNKIIGTFDINTTFNIRIDAVDNYGATASQIINVSSQYIPLDICDHGVAIGKASEKNAFEVNMNTEIIGSLKVNGNAVEPPLYATATISTANKWFTLFENVNENLNRSKFIYGGSMMLTISRDYNGINNESYRFSITGAFNNVTITQLSGVQNSSLCIQIRVVSTTDFKTKIEVYIKNSGTNSNIWYAYLENTDCPNMGKFYSKNFVASDDAGTVLGIVDTGFTPSGFPMMVSKELGDTQNLNNYIENGIWFQQYDSAASTGSNYPVKNAGMLTVNSNPSKGHVFQTYRTFGYLDNTYTRTRYNGDWSKWRSIGNGSGKEYVTLPIGDIYIVAGWNTIASGESAAKKVWFPIVFPNSCLSVVISNQWISGCIGNGYDMVITELQRDGFWMNPANNIGRKVQWVAFGY